MPLMLLNLRALPDGLESHKKYLEDEVGQWLSENREQADVTFICSSVSTDNTRTVRLPAHQAVLAPISSVLKDIFNQQSCSHRREMVYITMDTNPKVMQSVLCLVYKGTTSLSTKEVEELKSIVKMLGLTFPGGFERVIMEPGVSLPTVPMPEPEPIQSASVAMKRPRQVSPPPPEIKRPRQVSPPPPEIKRPREVSPPPPPEIKKPRVCPANRKIKKVGPSVNSNNSAKVSATDRMNMHVSMTLKLKDAPSGTTATCEMPNCGAEVTYEQLSDHFLVHETSDNFTENNSPISFPCVACGINFKFRRELDSHTKTKHGGGMSKNDKLNLLSDSDSDSDDGDLHDDLSSPGWTSVKSPNRTPVVCPQCNSTVPSSWHLPPSKHDCTKAVTPLVIKRPSSAQSDWSVDNKEAANYCNICDHTFKTVKAKTVHMKMKHTKEKSPLGNSSYDSSYSTFGKNLMDSKLALNFDSSSTVPPPSNKKYGCQICTKRFNEFCQLRTHYTLYHFWDNLAEDYKHLGDKCNICQRKYPTEDHLIQHMGNFHCLIDKYLVKKGLRIISSEKTIKLLNWKCEFCKVFQQSSAALKAHLAVKHYQKELLAEFPVERGKVKKCPKCYKVFEGSSVSTVIGHVGSFHDEVIKYALDILDLDQADKANVPVDDFDDGTIGELIKKEETHFTCEYQQCGEVSNTRNDLKSHYLDSHYAGQFMSDYPIPYCSFCDDQPYNSVLALHKHIVSKHEGVLCSMLSKDNISLPSYHSPKRRKYATNRGIFDYLFCQICLQEFHTSKSLKIHYIRHYQLNFQMQYFTVQCPFCDKKFDDVITTQKHIATEHANLSLIPLMEKENLWVDKSIILDQGTVKLKRCGLPMKGCTVDAAIIKKHFDEVGEVTPTVETSLTCPIPSCEKLFDTREKFLIHLAISHFWKDFNLEFGESFQADPVNCPICKEKVNPNSEKTVYIKHLAVVHETVMKYVQTIGREEPRIETANLPRLQDNEIREHTDSKQVPVIKYTEEINERKLDGDTNILEVQKTNIVADKASAENNFGINNNRHSSDIDPDDPPPQDIDDPDDPPPQDVDPDDPPPQDVDDPDDPPPQAVDDPDDPPHQDVDDPDDPPLLIDTGVTNQPLTNGVGVMNPTEADPIEPAEIKNEITLESVPGKNVLMDKIRDVFSDGSGSSSDSD